MTNKSKSPSIFKQLLGAVLGGSLGLIGYYGYTAGQPLIADWLENNVQAPVVAEQQQVYVASILESFPEQDIKEGKQVAINLNQIKPVAELLPAAPIAEEEVELFIRALPEPVVEDEESTFEEEFFPIIENLELPEPLPAAPEPEAIEEAEIEVEAAPLLPAAPTAAKVFYSGATKLPSSGASVALVATTAAALGYVIQRRRRKKSE